MADTGRAQLDKTLDDETGQERGAAWSDGWTRIFGPRLYTTVAVGMVALTVAAWLLNEQTTAFSMTLNGGLASIFGTIAIVFANRRLPATDGVRPLDLNFAIAVGCIVALVWQMVMIFVASGETAYMTNALDALIGVTVGVIGTGLMAKAKQDE